ncbi:kinase-like protein [Patellaria atrata CBS 101060]|uniref:Kinase-like protein n=1 Tax=Patellaria atrata CBS 101060 TaxID=1346257 RepID=A0A9P4VPN7_9PEZI|nr:kinase-like protein [Patellaria atrata CBS 101060]
MKGFTRRRQTLQGKNALFTAICRLRDRSDVLNEEAQMMRLFRGHDSIRQLVDQIDDPESVILEYMDDNVLNLLKRKQLPKIEAKRVLKVTFKELTALHDQNIVHTDIKSNNILVKCSTQGTRYKLSDPGDSESPDVPSNNGMHVICTEIFCAPEVPLAGAIKGIIFLLKNAPPPHLSMGVLQVQNDYYGPISRKQFERLVGYTVQPLLRQFEENYRQFPLSAGSREISLEDVEFFNSIMKIDPRQRPTAREALKHQWFYKV